MSGPFNVGDVERFWSRVDRRADDECWPWVGACRPYGQINICRQQVRSHVASWWIANGERPSPGMVVRHACDNPRCVNPGHLVLGRQADNVSDMLGRRRHWAHALDHCKAGHPLTPDNLGKNTRQRVCKACHRASSQRYKARFRHLPKADEQFTAKIRACRPIRKEVRA